MVSSPFLLIVERGGASLKEVVIRTVVGLVGISVFYGLLYMYWTAFADALERRDYPRWFLFLGPVGLYLIWTTEPKHPPRDRRWRRPLDVRRSRNRP